MRKAGTRHPGYAKCPPDQPRSLVAAIRLALTTIRAPTPVVTSSSLEITRIPLGACSGVTARTWPRICPLFSRLPCRLRRLLHPLIVGSSAPGGSRGFAARPDQDAHLAERAPHPRDPQVQRRPRGRSLVRQPGAVSRSAWSGTALARPPAGAQGGPSCARTCTRPTARSG